MTYRTDDSILMQKSQAFALRITNMVDYLSKNRGAAFAPIYNQVLRSGTSVMANVSEAQFAQSSADFITKLHIALKEANETRGWLRLLHEKAIINDNEHKSVLDDCSEIIAILVASIKTAKSNNSNHKEKGRGVK